MKRSAMNDPPPEVKVSTLRSQSDDDKWQLLHYNQERMIANQDQLVEMSAKLLANQQQMAALATKLDGHLNTLGDALSASTNATKNIVDKIVQVPITIVVIAAASWLFYLKYIEEWTWLVICAVAAFRFLGDSITAVVKLFGIGRGNGSSSPKT